MENSPKQLKEKINKSDFSEQGKQSLAKILEKYTLEIETKPNYIVKYCFTNELTLPVKPKIFKPYALPIAIYDKAENKIQEMIDKGFIKKIEGAIYTFSLFSVQTKWRFTFVI